MTANKKPVAWGLLLAVLLSIGGYFWHLHRLEVAAQEAIQAALDACRDGYAPEYYRRKVEARAAIRAVDSFFNPWRRVELDAHFQNELLMSGCP
ncbi:MAG: hypothetical protein ACE5HB_03385 [Terriglobia bacterium]